MKDCKCGKHKGLTEAAGGTVLSGPALLRVGERDPKDKEFETDEFVLAPPGTIVAPRRKGVEPTLENALLAIADQVQQARNSKGRKDVKGAQEGAAVEKSRKRGKSKGKMTVSEKIKLLIEEGMSREQAVAIALEMQRRGELVEAQEGFVSTPFSASRTIRPDRGRPIRPTAEDLPFPVHPGRPIRPDIRPDRPGGRPIIRAEDLLKRIAAIREGLSGLSPIEPSIRPDRPVRPDIRPDRPSTGRPIRAEDLLERIATIRGGINGLSPFEPSTLTDRPKFADVPPQQQLQTGLMKELLTPNDRFSPRNDRKVGRQRALPERGGLQLRGRKKVFGNPSIRNANTTRKSPFEAQEGANVVAGLSPMLSLLGSLSNLAGPLGVDLPLAQLALMQNLGFIAPFAFGQTDPEDFRNALVGGVQTGFGFPTLERMGQQFSQAQAIAQQLGLVSPELFEAQNPEQLAQAIQSLTTGGAFGTGTGTPTFAREQFGFQQEQFDEAVRQFGERLGLDEAQLAQASDQFKESLGFQREELGEGARQFDTGLAQRAKEFGARLSAEESQFARNLAERQAQRAFDQALSGFRSFGLGQRRPSQTPTAGLRI